MRRVARLDIRLLGPPRFLVDGEPWRFAAPPRALPLIAYLALQRGPVSRPAAGAALWPDETEDVARTNLRRHLHRVRAALPSAAEPWIVEDKKSVAINRRAPLVVDVNAFETLLESPAKRADAVDLYGGDLLAAYDDEWLVIERERLRARYVDALLGLAVARRRERDFADSIRYAERLLGVDDLREDALRELVAARYEAGDRAGALAAYERFARRLYDEMAVEPMPETAALRDAVLANIALPQAAEDAAEQLVARGIRVAPLPFVGRTRALDALRSAWSRAARGHGSTTFVTGEAGIGKSRLATELAQVVTSQGGRVLVGTTSSPQSTPYQAIVETLRRGLPYLARSAVDPLWLSAVAPLLPECLGLRDGLGAAEPLEPERARSRLHEAFVQLFTGIARTRPLVVVLEDLQWAHDDTADALAALARRAGGLPLLVIATYRSEAADADHPLREVRRMLAGERRASVLALEPLSAEDVASLVARMPELEAAPEHLAGSLHRATDGNPLFVGQLVRTYVETRALPDDAGAGVGAAIAARLERLDAAARTVAEIAATAGREFSVEMVADVSGWAESAVADAISTLMDRQLVRETGAPGFEYGFTHAVIAATVYDRADPALRAIRHRRAARHLERTEGAAPATVARHWAAAGEPERAAAAFERAAREAVAVYAHGDAIAYANAGLSLCGDPRRCYELLRVLVASHAQHGDVDAWARSLEEFERAASGFGDDERFTALEERERYCAQLADRAAQRRTIEAMQALADAAQSPAWRAKTLDALGMLEAGVGDFRSAIAPLRGALNAARESGVHALIVRARRHLVQALTRHGEIDAARSELDALRVECVHGGVDDRLDLLWAESSLALAVEDGDMLAAVAGEMLALSERCGDVDAQAKAHWMLGGAALQRGDGAAVHRHYDLAAVHFERLRQPQSLATTLINHGTYHFDVGRLSEAIDLFHRAAVLAQDCEARNLVAYARANAADAERLRGNLEAARADALVAYARALETGEQRITMTALQVLGDVECARGDVVAGVAHLRDAAAMARSAKQRTSLVAPLCSLIEVSLTAGSNAEARACAVELAGIVAEIPHDLRSPTRVWAALAAEARSSGDLAAARDYEARGRDALETALTRCEDDAARAAFRALPFNRALAAARPSPVPAGRRRASGSGGAGAG
jgi:DNA-binding SARP family transcriptional activator/energy-coupling factor transporter ATP-binding protein EcfA2